MDAFITSHPSSNNNATEAKARLLWILHHQRPADAGKLRTLSTERKRGSRGDTPARALRRWRCRPGRGDSSKTVATTVGQRSCSWITWVRASVCQPPRSPATVCTWGRATGSLGSCPARRRRLKTAVGASSAAARPESGDPRRSPTVRIIGSRFVRAGASRLTALVAPDSMSRRP